MYCRYCGSPNKDDARFCEACGKQLVEKSDAIVQDKEDSLNTNSNQENKVDVNQVLDHNVTDLTFFDLGEFDIENSTIDELDCYIQKGVAKLNDINAELRQVEKYSFQSKVLTAVTQTTILNGFRENAEQKKLRKYLSTKIYRGLSYDEIGECLQYFAEKLSSVQSLLQRSISKESSQYFDNASMIIDAIYACIDSWEQISPDTYKSELTRATDNFTYVLGLQTKYWIEKEFIKMDLPSKYKFIQNNVDHVDNDNSGCLSVIVLLLGTSILAACSCLF